MNDFLKSEIDRTFEVAKLAVSSLYSRLDLLDYKDAGKLVQVLADIVDLQHNTRDWMDSQH